MAALSLQSAERKVQSAERKAEKGHKPRILTKGRKPRILRFSIKNDVN